MKTSKITKIISILVIIAAITLSLNTVLAKGETTDSVTIPKATAVESKGFTETVGNVLGVVTYVCYAAAVILLIILGVKWLMAAPDTKADMKKTAITYVIGAIMIFAAGAIVQVIKGLGSSVVKAE